MERTEKWYKKKWFKPTIAIIGIGLVILIIELYVHQPFKGFFTAMKNIRQATQTENSIDMSEVVTETDPYLGNKEAKIQIVEFGDFDCLYCKAASSIIRELMIEYKDQVFYQFRDYPSVSEHSIWLAMAGACAHEQDKFWSFHDKLFQLQGSVTEANIYQLAQSVGIKNVQFKSCLTNERYKNEVAEDYTTAERLAVRGTPTLFINGRKIQGVMTKESFKQVLDRLIEINYTEN